MNLTAGVPVDRAGRQLRFRLGGVAGGVRAGVERRQSLKHAEEAVGGGKLQVFLRDVADLPAAVPGLDGTMTVASEPFRSHLYYHII